MALAIYVLLSTAMYYLGSRALITEPIWKLYPSAFARFMDCAACTGFWWGLIWAVVVGQSFQVNVGPFPAQHVATPPLVGLCMLVLVPIAAAAMHRGLEILGVAVIEDDSQ